MRVLKTTTVIYLFALFFFLFPGRGEAQSYAIYPLGIQAQTQDLVADNTGALHLIWVGSWNYLYYGRIVPNGSDDYTISGQQTIAQIASLSQSFTRPRMAVHPDGSSVHVVYLASYTEMIHAWKTTGAWSTETIPAGSPYFAFPAVAVNASGTVHFIAQRWSYSSVTSPIIYLRKPAGSSWTSPVDISPNNAEYRDCAMFTDPAGGVHATWHAGGRPGYYRYAPNGTNLDTVSTMEIPRLPDVATNCFGDLFAKSNGEAHTAFFAWGSTGTIDHSIRPAGGAWQTPTRPSLGGINFTDDVWPAVVSDSQKTYVAWAEAPSGGVFTQLKLAIKTSGSWTKYDVDNSATVPTYSKVSMALSSGGIYGVWRSNMSPLFPEQLILCAIAKLINVTSPLGGEQWMRGSSQTITWNTTETITNVRIEYSTNGGSTWTDVIASTPNDGTHPWTVPNAPSTNCYIRITDTANAANADRNDVPFSIIIPPPTIIVLTPNGGEGLRIGTSTNITWDFFEMTGNVRIDLLNYSGATYTISESVPIGNRSYSWTVGQHTGGTAPAGTGYQVRISHIGSSVADSSNNIFTLITTDIQLASPNGYETWPVGGVRPIRWNAVSGITSVRLEYSVNGGSSWTNIIASTANTGLYNWTVPNAPSALCRVRVSDAANGAANDASDANFAIVTSLPAYKKYIDFNGDNRSDILWRYYGTGGYQGWDSLWFPHPNGSFYDAIVIATEADLNWRVGGAGDLNRDGVADIFWRNESTGSDGGRNRVWYMNGNGTVKGVEELQQIIDPGWKMYGVGDFDGDQVVDILMRHTGTGENAIVYMFDDGTPKGVIDLTPVADLNWTMAGAADFDNDGIGDILWRYFGTGGYQGWNSVWYMRADGTVKDTRILGVESNLNWKIGGAGDINGDGIPDIFWRYYGTDATQGATRIWFLDVYGNTIGTGASMTVSDLSWTIVNNGYRGSSVIPATVTVTAPNGGETWTVGTSQNITWGSTGTIANVRIEYSTTNGSSWTNVIASTPNDGTQPWTIPNSPSTTCLVRISDASNAAVNDVSNAVFTISTVVTPTITVTAPNGGETWTVGTTPNITWTNTGSIANVRIEYSTNNGSSWTNVIASTPNDGTHPWTIPNYPSTQCLVRISDASNAAVNDVSNTVFTISVGGAAALTLVTPNGYENWQAGTVHPIVWSTSGVVSDVKIEYSTNGGTSWTTAATVSNTGTYDWTVPGALSANYRIRVSDATNAGVNDASDASFAVVSSLPAYKRYVDFNNDNRSDILWRYYGAGEYQGWNSLWFTNTNGSFGDSLILATESDLNWRVGGAGDLNRDGVPDLLWRNHGSGADQGRMRIWYMNGNGTVKGVEELPQLVDLGWRLCGVSDFDGDGVNDILLRYYGTGTDQGRVRIWYMYDDGRLKGTKDLMTVADTNWTVVGIADFDIDGVSDLLWRYYGSGEYQGWNSLWYMNTNGTIKDTKILSGVGDLKWKVGGAGDINGDGVPDIFWRYQGTGGYQGWNSIWFLRNDGSILNTNLSMTVPDLAWTMVNNGGYYVAGGGGALAVPPTTQGNSPMAPMTIDSARISSPWMVKEE